MSTAKRSRRRQTEARAASPLPASKRLKTTKTSHVPAQGGLGFLVDEDARNGKKLEARLTDGVPSSKATRVDESHAVVAPDTKDNYQVGSSTEYAIGISSGEESSEDSSDDEIAVAVPAGRQLEVEKPLVNGHLPLGELENEDAVGGAEDSDMAEAGSVDEAEEEEPEEPSFGDMLQARHPDTIDVRASFPDPMADRQALIPASGDRALVAPSGTSLVTVLTQALKTNDKYMLESCFHTTDQQSIRTTVQRLQSQYIATLLQRLAERIHKRPGRTGKLLIWIQWSLVAHGGYLATQPDVMRKLKALSQVIRERANGLQPLLHLKGKLDMLSAQLELRRSMQAASRAAHAEDDEDEEGVVYVEGQDEDWSASEDDAVAGARDDAKTIEPVLPKSNPKLQMATPRTDASVSGHDSDSDEDMPNGVAQEVDDDDSAEEDAEEGMLDVEAEETSDDDSAEDDDSDEEADSAPDSESASDLSDDDSEVSGPVKQPNPATLNRRR